MFCNIIPIVTVYGKGLKQLANADYCRADLILPEPDTKSIINRSGVFVVASVPVNHCLLYLLIGQIA